MSINCLQKIRFSSVTLYLLLSVFVVDYLRELRGNDDIGDTMKRLICGVIAGLSVSAIAAPAHAAFFRWDVEYTGWWDAEGGGSVVGSFVADGADAADGLVSSDEIESWFWSWSGNDFAAAFDISSSDPAAASLFVDGFFVDGTPNLPDFRDGVDQGLFIGGTTNEQSIDFEFLTIETINPNGTFEISFGDSLSNTGRITVSDPTKVPEPAAIVGLFVLAAISGANARHKQEA